MLVLTVATGMEVFQGWMLCHHRVEFHGLWERFLPKWDQGNGGGTFVTAFFFFLFSFLVGDNNKPCSVVMPNPNLNKA